MTCDHPSGALTRLELVALNCTALLLLCLTMGYVKLPLLLLGSLCYMHWLEATFGKWVRL